MGLWSKLFGRKVEEPLRGAPDVRRLKTYSAESGYVYLYTFSGMRVNQRDGEVGTDYVFDITPDRKTWSSATIFLGHTTLNRWMRHHGRDLSASERYGIAKIALMQLFDSSIPARLAEADVARLDQPDLERIASILDLL